MSDEEKRTAQRCAMAGGEDEARALAAEFARTYGTDVLKLALEQRLAAIPFPRLRC